MQSLGRANNESNNYTEIYRINLYKPVCLVANDISTAKNLTVARILPKVELFLYLRILLTQISAV